jgi:hypothetical protein
MVPSNEASNEILGEALDEFWMCQRGTWVWRGQQLVAKDVPMLAQANHQNIRWYTITSRCFSLTSWAIYTLYSLIWCCWNEQKSIGVQNTSRTHIHVTKSA